MRTTVVLLAVGLLVAPVGAGGQLKQFREWNYVCTPGAMQGCISASMVLEYDPYTRPEFGGATRAYLRVANLQGSESWLPDPGAFSLVTVSFDYLQAVSPRIPNGVDGGLSWGAPVTEGDAEGSYAERALFYDHYDGPQAGSMYFHRYAGTQFVGCDIPPPMSGIRYTSYTCGGALNYEALWTGRVEFTDRSTLSMVARSVTGGQYHEAVRCTVGIDCITVTPEPSTWLLLATGLLGLGWFARRRESITRFGAAHGRGTT